MDKITFENLPSTNTPVDADNLNDMQDNIEEAIEESGVAVGSLAPSTGEHVWLKKGKNLFDKANIIKGFRFGSDGDLYTDANFNASDYIAIESNTQYTASWTVQTTDCVCYYDKNKSFISRNTTDKTFTTPSNCKFIRVSIRNANLDTAQVEQGATTTSYEGYIEKEIYTKNNGVLERFYNEKDIPQLDASRWSSQLLGYRYAINKSVIYAGTVVASFSSGVLTFNISTLGLAEKPDTVQLTANSQRYAMRYDYDSSTATSLKIELINNGSVYSYSGNVRFSMTVYGKLA